MDIDDVNGDLGISRRQLIKRGAIVGGTVLWAAPVVQSLTTPAFAQMYPGQGCQCTSTACALRVSGLVTLNACGGNPCVVNATVGVGGGTITAGALCATTEATAGANNACDASSSVAQLNITNVTVNGLLVNAAATVLEQTISASCGCGTPTVGNNIATLVINGHNALTVTGRAALSALGITVVVNGRSCNNGTARASALDVNILNALRIVVAEVTARAGNCTTC